MHTLIASLAFRDDKLWAVVGCMGADGQPQIHLQTYIAMIDFGRDIQEALRNAALAIGPLCPRRAARYAAYRRAALRRRRSMSWHVAATQSIGGPIGMSWPVIAHGITIDPESGVLNGGAGSAQRWRGDRILSVAKMNSRVRRK
jgi:gamma-glutamyltranspeptidase/glutathione hydrolase